MEKNIYAIHVATENADQHLFLEEGTPKQVSKKVIKMLDDEAVYVIDYTVRGGTPTNRKKISTAICEASEMLKELL